MKNRRRNKCIEDDAMNASLEWKHVVELKDAGKLVFVIDDRIFLVDDEFIHPGGSQVRSHPNEFSYGEDSIADHNNDHSPLPPSFPGLAATQRHRYLRSLSWTCAQRTPTQPRSIPRIRYILHRQAVCSDSPPPTPTPTNRFPNRRIQATPMASRVSQCPIHAVGEPSRARPSSLLCFPLGRSRHQNPLVGGSPHLVAPHLLLPLLRARHPSHATGAAGRMGWSGGGDMARHRILPPSICLSFKPHRPHNHIPTLSHPWMSP